MYDADCVMYVGYHAHETKTEKWLKIKKNATENWAHELPTESSDLHAGKICEQMTFKPEVIKNWMHARWLNGK